MNIPDPLNTSTFTGLTKGGSLSQVNHLNGRQDTDYGRVSAGHLSGRGFTESTSPEALPAAPGTSSTPPPVSGTGVPLWKRLMDFSVIVAATPLWVPCLIFVALWIKLTSKGPVLFRQTRIGQDGRCFTLLKFRSMKTGADTGTHEKYFKHLVESGGSMIKLDALDDPRLIPGGRILRASGLDELPQLWHVIRGEMSLVGPRPCTAEEFECFNDWQKTRVKAPPGLTGYWQVNGKNKTTFNQMIDMDIKYAERMSPLFDIAILAATAPAILLQIVEASKSRVAAAPATRSAPAPLRGHSTQQIS